ncbi:TPA: hypothetical protein HA297_01270 [Candidatus Woesearchaeota archaeon]|nr:hypothetical protein [Candidatus Woesearchaeota archaeon]HII88177.1 hypothetical protein [Candidatus Woesearchaeota archaeon]
MKIIHLYAHSDLELLPAVKKAVEQDLLKESVALVTTIQHTKIILEVAEFLSKQGLAVTNYGNILGCMHPKVAEIPEKTLLYIGDGLFHPKGLCLRLKRDVVVANPATQQAFVLKKEEIADIEKRLKGARLKFHTATQVGVLISVKSGQKTVQQTVPKIMKIQEKYPDKKFYFFGANTLDIQSLEDFPFIEVWMNTMCPRMVDDDVKFPKPMLNLMDLEGENII